MGTLHIVEEEKSLDRGVVKSGNTVKEGELIVCEDDGGDGVVRRFEPANDTFPHGIVVHHRVGDSIAEHDEDYVAYNELWTYDGGEELYYQPLAASSVILPWSMAEQTSPASSEPTFSEYKTIGVVDFGNGPRVVPSGYTYDGTTYSESGAGDFVAIGRMDTQLQTTRISESYDERIPVRLDLDLLIDA